MKPTIIIILIFSLLACNQQTDKTRILQNHIDSLEIELANTYKPGFGELMSNVQSQHSKLWFAGLNKNWKLANFEVKEILEAIQDIQKYQTERKESQIIGMINPALDSVRIAIQQKNLKLFRNSYTLLTNSCNNCHLLTDFEFNVVKIPNYQPFSNQDFSVKE